MQSNGELKGGIDALKWEPSGSRSAMRFSLYGAETLLGYLEIQFEDIQLIE